MSVSLTRAVGMRRGYVTTVRLGGCLGGAEDDGALVRLGDDLVARLLVLQPAVLHAEVQRLEMVGDDRDRGLLRLDGVAAGQSQADLSRLHEREELLVLGLLGHRGIAPRVPAALPGREPEVGADP